ncbi:hypothetical protein AB3N04_13990 [Alkalihalophilus sp. As8PL]|uniref:Uncharacterized protein n=1 Tax=Alkalihalophilus sp. As8PL TaxID=3237103 RepID=A0AB39BQW9_9BACI
MMVLKGSIVCCLLLSFIATSFSHLHLNSQNDHFPSYITGDLDGLENIGGLTYSPAVEFIEFSSISSPFPNLNRYSSTERSYLTSYIPLLKVKTFLMTIKFKSTFFSF